MEVNKRMLIAIDTSEASHRAVDYVAALIGGRRGFHLCLAHVLPPFPPRLLEHGGAETPEVEEEIESAMRDEQASWLEQAEREAQPMLEQAVAKLHEARVPKSGIKTQCVTSIGGKDIVTELLEVAQADDCDTIVVGRESFTGLQRFLKHHVADELIRRGRQHTIWVVE